MNSEYYAILGINPSKGARSPILWNRVFKKLKINSKMICIDIEPKLFNQKVNQLFKDKNFKGGAITNPYKEKIFKKLEKKNITKSANKCGALNLIVRNGSKFLGFNTDGEAALIFLKTKVRNLSNKKILKDKLKMTLKEKNKILSLVFNQKKISINTLVDDLMKRFKFLKEFIVNTEDFLNKSINQGKSILFEGAQGISLDVDHGIYPYTTSSNTAAGHISTGTGVSFRDIDRIIGVVKAYLSRVGESPLPSEIDGEMAEKIRDVGGEYGTTTGRPRRIGWLDLVQVRQAVRVNGLTEIALTKLDVLNGIKEIPVCIDYEIDGSTVSEMPASLTMYRNAKPVYKTLEGWDFIPDNIWDKGFNALPKEIHNYIDFIEQAVGCSVKIISVGPQRHETIIR